MATDPLSLPPMTARQITDSSTMPGYPVRASDVPSGSDAVTYALTRLARAKRANRTD